MWCSGLFGRRAVPVAVVIGFVLVAAASPAVAASAPSSAWEAPLGGADWVSELSVEESLPVMARDLPWLSPRDFRYQQDRTVNWNMRYRAGRGSVGMIAEFHKFFAVEKNQDTYLQGADFEQIFNVVRASGTLFPGFVVWFEGGYNITSVRPQDELRYDRYSFGYSVGFGFSASLEFGRMVSFVIDANFRTHEHNTIDAGNTFVSRQNGGEANLREYQLHLDGKLVVELVGDPMDGFFALMIGGGWHLVEGRLEGPTDLLHYMPLVSRQFDVMAGFIVGIGERIAVTAEIKFIGILAPKLMFQLYF